MVCTRRVYAVAGLLFLTALGTTWRSGQVALAQGDSQPPGVSSHSPSSNATAVSAGINVTATFTEPVQAASISFVLRNASNAVVPAAVSYNVSTLTATLDPDAALSGSSTYTATISGVTDLAGNLLSPPVVWSFTTATAGFQESVVFSGLVQPTVIEFAPDGRVFVAEKSGIIKVFASVSATTPTVFADLRGTVYDVGASGLLGLALDPGFPAMPYVYVLYTYDGGTVPRWGRLSRLQANGNVMSGVEQVLVEDWLHWYPGQTVGGLAFGPDGALYASAGDGASATFVDHGQTDNPSLDPPNEGGALRSQDLRTPADPVTLNGSIIRVHPDTGRPLPQTTSMVVGAPTVDAHGVKSIPVTSAFQGPVATIVRVLEPTNPAPGKPHRLLYVLPVAPGVTGLGSPMSDGLEELRLLDAHNRFNVTLIAPSFHIEPWYGDHDSQVDRRLESFLVRDLVPFGDSFAAPGEIPPRWIIGFSKSGSGALSLILRHPNVFSAAAAWDAPAQFTNMSAFPGMAENFGTEANFDRYEIPSLVVSSAEALQTANRLWISGDQSAWTSHMLELTSQLGQASVPHTFVQSGPRAHSWPSGWLEGGITSLDANALPEPPVDVNAQRIIASGLRQPSRFTFRPGTHEIWVGDAGWNNWEEINRIPSAADGIVENFGWPCYEGPGTTAYAGAGLEICTDLYAQPADATPPFYAFRHGEAVVAGDSCGASGGSISGLAFYGTGGYPAAYEGALFFSDSSRNCIWAMFRGADGLPDPANRAPFVSGAASPVDLKIGAGGDLFYADLAGGTVRRIHYSAGNLAPTAVIQTGPRSGPSPLTVDFDGTGSSDPGGAVLSYAWDLDGDGLFDDSTALRPSFTYTGSGTRTVRLRVTDPQGLSDVASVVVSFTDAADTTPPVRSNGQPSGTLAAGTSQTTLSLATGEAASCRYATTPGVVYASMANVFATTGGGAHATPVSGLTNGTSYSFHVRCQDAAGNANPDDFTISFAVAQPPPPGGGLVAAYGFNEGSGASAGDATGNGQTGVVAGAVWTTEGRFGNALAFDGVNDWVTVNASPLLDLTTGMTLEAWVFPTALTANWNNVIIKERPGGEVYNLYANIDSSVPIVYVVTAAEPGLPLPALGATQLALNVWTHLAATYDGTALRLFVNGVEVGSRALSGPLLTSTGALRIGGNSIWIEFFHGRIDEIRIYNRALTPAEIQDDMTRPIIP